jgi:membrane protein implicated in regulation of membrane protease activity
MCFAWFIATGSFFLGQQDALPQAVRGSPVLFVLAFAPFAVMAFWLIRLRLGKRLRRSLESLHDRSDAFGVRGSKVAAKAAIGAAP